MKVAIMQPYFIPYIGYFQLINEVDTFVLYDNIEYTKKGWINRNRILLNGKDEYITLPIKKGSDYLSVIERELSESFDSEKKKILRKIQEAYKKAPYFNEAYQLIERILSFDDKNLFKFIHNSIVELTSFLNIDTKIIASSTIPINHNLKSQDKVIAICNHINATTYINPIGGTEIYEEADFKLHNIELFFLKSENKVYKQFKNDFIPWLSILDILMFNNTEEVKNGLLSNFALVKKNTNEI